MCVIRLVAEDDVRLAEFDVLLRLSRGSSLTTLIAIATLFFHATEATAMDPHIDITLLDDTSHAYQDCLLDEALAETFPASDPISPSHIT